VTLCPNSLSHTLLPQGDKDFYEGQLADLRSDITQSNRRLEDVKAELEKITSGAAKKQADRALKDAEKTVSYVRKHLFHLFKTTGQERVREYTKEARRVRVRVRGEA